MPKPLGSAPRLITNLCDEHDGFRDENQRASPMKKRWISWCALGVAVIVVAVMIEPTRIVRGWLRGEQFFAGRPSSYWSHEIRDQHPEGRFANAVGLVLGNEPDPAAVPMLIELLEDENDEVRYVACNALAANGPSAQRAVPVLLKMLRHSNLFYRRNSAHALAAIGPMRRP